MLQEHGLEVAPVQCALVGVRAWLIVHILIDHQHVVPACLAGSSEGHIAQKEGWQVARWRFSLCPSLDPRNLPQPRPFKVGAE